MSRQLDQELEVKQANRAQALMRALDYGLEGAVAHSGGVLLGFSVKYGHADVLMIIRATLAGRKQVAFVGSETFAGCVIKAVRDGQSDNLRWKPDKFST